MTKEDAVQMRKRASKDIMTGLLQIASTSSDDNVLNLCQAINRAVSDLSIATTQLARHMLLADLETDVAITEHATSAIKRIEKSMKLREVKP